MNAFFGFCTHLNSFAETTNCICLLALGSFYCKRTIPFEEERGGAFGVDVLCLNFSIKAADKNGI